MHRCYITKKCYSKHTHAYRIMSSDFVGNQQCHGEHSCSHIMGLNDDGNSCGELCWFISTFSLFPNFWIGFVSICNIIIFLYSCCRPAYGLVSYFQFWKGFSIVLRSAVSSIAEIVVPSQSKRNHWEEMCLCICMSVPLWTCVCVCAWRALKRWMVDIMQESGVNKSEIEIRKSKN